MRSLLIRAEKDLQDELRQAGYCYQDGRDPWNVLLVSGLHVSDDVLVKFRRLLFDLRDSQRCLLGLRSDTTGNVTGLLRLMLRVPRATIKIIERAYQPFEDVDDIFAALGRGLRKQQRHDHPTGFILDLWTNLDEIGREAWEMFVDGIHCCPELSVVDIVAPPLHDATRMQQLTDAILTVSSSPSTKIAKDIKSYALEKEKLVQKRNVFEHFSFRCAAASSLAAPATADNFYPCTQFLRSNAQVESLSLGGANVSIGANLVTELIKYCLKNHQHLKALQFDRCHIDLDDMLRFLRNLPKMTALEDLWMHGLRLNDLNGNTFKESKGRRQTKSLFYNTLLAVLAGSDSCDGDADAVVGCKCKDSLSSSLIATTIAGFSRLQNIQLTWDDDDMLPIAPSQNTCVLPASIQYYLHFNKSGKRHRLHEITDEDWMQLILSIRGENYSEDFGLSLEYSILRHNPNRWCRPF